MTAEKLSKEGKYQISVVAEMLDVHPQTLRNYERIGLITPPRTEGKLRLYSDYDIRELERILTLRREMGVNLAGIEIIMRLRRRIEALQDEFRNLTLFIQELIRRTDISSDQLNTLQSRFNTVIAVEHIGKESETA